MVYILLAFVKRILDTLAMVWGVLSSGMVGKNGEIYNEYNTAEELMLLNCGVGEDS